MAETLAQLKKRKREEEWWHRRWQWILNSREQHVLGVFKSEDREIMSYAFQKVRIKDLSLDYEQAQTIQAIRFTWSKLR